MKTEKETFEEQYAELADFCFRKLVNLESRFVQLCVRAEAAGIPCSDLHHFTVKPEAEAAPRGLN